MLWSLRIVVTCSHVERVSRCTLRTLRKAVGDDPARRLGRCMVTFAGSILS